jgi:archaellum component FlaC
MFLFNKFENEEPRTKTADEVSDEFNKLKKDFADLEKEHMKRGIFYSELDYNFLEVDELIDLCTERIAQLEDSYPSKRQEMIDEIETYMQELKRRKDRILIPQDEYVCHWF